MCITIFLKTSLCYTINENNVKSDLNDSKVIVVKQESNGKEQEAPLKEPAPKEEQYHNPYATALDGLLLPDPVSSFFELIRLKYFFHFAGLTKYIGSCIAEQIPFKTPKD